MNEFLSKNTELRPSFKNKKFVFIAGLHKSGTSILFKCLKAHPQISAFHNTGFPEDEGQFLQTVYPIAKEYGGPGKFGFDERMHLTEKSDLINQTNKEKLFLEWCRYWDLLKPVFLEKSPPNLLKTRFLQEMFPNSYFIIVTRHPLAAAYSTQNWRQTPLNLLLKHWIYCHEIFQNDYQFLTNVIWIKYEHFVNKSKKYLEDIYKFIGIENHTNCIEIEKNTNEKYFKKWKLEINSFDKYFQDVIVQNLPEYENRIKKFGYSFYDQ
jgi:hypothetical protein